MTEVKDAIEYLKTEFPKFTVSGQTCNTAGVSDPPKCYEHIYGPIKYTKDQRMEWEKKMEEILWRKFSRRFNPVDYPTTNMI